jgi:hypothetical protein
MSKSAEPKIIFAPGCFDDFDGTQEELDELVASINKMVESGELFEKATPIDLDQVIDELTEEELAELMILLGESDDPDTPPRMLQ